MSESIIFLFVWDFFPGPAKDKANPAHSLTQAIKKNVLDFLQWLSQSCSPQPICSLFHYRLQPSGNTCFLQKNDIYKTIYNSKIHINCAKSLQLWVCKVLVVWKHSALLCVCLSDQEHWAERESSASPSTASVLLTHCHCPRICWLSALFTSSVSC